MSDEIRLTIEGQEYYRGNRSPAWFAVNGGLAERTDDCYWPVFERIAELEQDAKRYRWLRTAGAWESEVQLDMLCFLVGSGGLTENPENFDEAIDAAMKGGKG